MKTNNLGKTIVFDADGVVIHRRNKRFSERISAKLNLPYEEILPFFENEFKKCLIGKADLRTEIKPYLKKWSWKKSTKELLRYWFEGEKVVDKKIIAYIKQIRRKGIKCCLATNQEKYRFNFMKKNLGLADIFDKLFSSCDAGFKKPDKRFYELILKELKIKPENIIFWDDNEKNVLAAKQAGINAYLYKNYQDFKKKTEKFLES